MSGLSIRLFGRLSVHCNNRAVRGLNASKVQELFCYLLLHRDRPHPREALASLLWGDTPTTQSKKYLRQCLWQLQGALPLHGEPVDRRTLRVESEWVQLNSAAGLQLDVASFEAAVVAAQGVPIHELDAAQARTLQAAADLYQGDLLEGWYQEWCLYERERLQNLYLTMLDKLMAHCEVHQQYEAGLSYGTRSLRYDRARECTHQRLMRLHYLAGDRAAALRQYERCVAALKEELGVTPSEPTVALYEQTRAGWLDASAVMPRVSNGAHAALASEFPGVLGRLKQLGAVLADIQRQIQHDIQIVERALDAHGESTRPR